MNTDNIYGRGIKYIFYSGHYQGHEDNLRKWKERLLFQPSILISI